jgi:hypothetical protein
MKRTHQLLRILFASAIVGSVVCTNAQTLLLNGSFESPSVGDPWYYRGAPTDWTQLGGGVDVTHINYAQGGFTAGAQNGVQFLDMNQAASSVGGLFQTVNVSAGTTYLLSLYAASWRGDAYGTLVYSLIDPAGSAVLATDTFTVNQVDTGAAGTNWVYLTLSTTAVSSALKVQIEQYASSTAGLAVDNVSLVAVPEPSTCALLAGLGALSLVACRRRG